MYIGGILGAVLIIALIVYFVRRAWITGLGRPHR